jgi:hypothetical protein
MKILSASSPRWDNHARTSITINAMIEAAPAITGRKGAISAPAVVIGPAPFSASAEDPEPHGRDAFARAVAGEFGPIAPPAQASLDETKMAKIRELRVSCAAAITGGFASSALGSPHIYPSKPTDQTNLMGAVVTSMLPSASEEGWFTPFWCEDAAGAWAFRDHTVGQIQRVGEDGRAHIAACQTRLDELTDVVNSAATVDDVDKISWQPIE